ncbi:MAG: AEC family transporter [Oscillospiraceae bacterium]|nr:AEC family transporter [Oscillospiraceae bacterium]
MKELVVLQVTIFAMMAVGFCARKLNLVSAAGKKEITNLVLYLILPANIITSFLVEFSEELLRDCVVILIVSILIQAFCLFYGKLIYRRQPEDRKKNLVYATICSNSGFLGNPVAEGIYGAPGLMLASIFLIPQRIMMWSEGLSIYTESRGGKGILKSVLTHPCVIACMIGIVLMLTRAKVPDVILTPLKTLGRCNTAMSMLVIGMILAEADLKTIIDRTILWFTLNRLILIPLVIFLALRFLPVSSLVRGDSVILAAMPAGATTSMLAAKYDRNPGFAAKLVAFSTLLSLPAICLWTWIVRL